MVRLLGLGGGEGYGRPEEGSSHRSSRPEASTDPALNEELRAESTPNAAGKEGSGFLLAGLQPPDNAGVSNTLNVFPKHSGRKDNRHNKVDWNILVCEETGQRKVELRGDKKVRGQLGAVGTPLPHKRGFGFCKGPLGEGLLTCWVNAACGDDGLLLGAPSALSGLESQGRSFESGSRGVCAKPKPSSASAMVCPGPCDRAGSCTEDRKERGGGGGRERGRERKVGSAILGTRGNVGPPLSSYQHLRSQLKEAEEGLLINITITL